MRGKRCEHGSHTPQPSSATAIGLAPQAARGPVVRPPPWCVIERSPGQPAVRHPQSLSPIRASVRELRCDRARNRGSRLPHQALIAREL